MLSEATASTAPAKLTAPAPNRRITSLSFQEWFRGSKIVDSHGAPLPVYHASPTTAPLQPKSYGSAGEHKYFYFAISQAWARNLARDFGGASWFIRKFYLALKNPIDLRALYALKPTE